MKALCVLSAVVLSLYLQAVATLDAQKAVVLRCNARIAEAQQDAWGPYRRPLPKSWSRT